MNTLDLRTFAHHLLGARQTQAIYPPEHPRVADAIRELFLSTTDLLGEADALRVALVDNELVLDERPVPSDGDLFDGFARALRKQGIGKLVVKRGVRRWELAALARVLSMSAEDLEKGGGPQAILEAEGSEQIVAGPITTGSPGKAHADRLSAAWEAYVEGLQAARRLRERLDEGIDEDAAEDAHRLARCMVGVVDAQPDAFVRLQALKSHDDYSFTHSLNVAQVSLSMAKAMGLPQESLMQVAMAAILHDVGKELVPDGVLNKPGKLTEEEWVVMKRHSADGVKLLLRTEEPDDIAVVVAYEHQLAYEHDNPDHGRWPLHFISQLICVADVYDALRSNRPYRAAMAPDRAMRIMEEETAQKFDADLFAGFRRMLGYYPPGTVVRLSDGTIAVSERADPDDVERPSVLAVRRADGADVEPPELIQLSQRPDLSVAEVVDGESLGIDPMDYL